MSSKLYLPSFAIVADCLSRLPKSVKNDEAFKAFWDDAVASYENDRKREAEFKRKQAAEVNALLTFTKYFSHDGGAVKYLNGKMDYILRKYLGKGDDGTYEKALCPTCGKPTRFLDASVVEDAKIHCAYPPGKLIEMVFGCEKCKNHVSFRFYAKGYEVRDPFKNHLKENRARMLYDGISAIREFVVHRQFFIDGHKMKAKGRKVKPLWAKAQIV